MATFRRGLRRGWFPQGRRRSRHSRRLLRVLRQALIPSPVAGMPLSTMQRVNMISSATVMPGTFWQGEFRSGSKLLRTASTRASLKKDLTLPSSDFSWHLFLARNADGLALTRRQPKAFWMVWVGQQVNQAAFYMRFVDDTETVMSEGGKWSEMGLGRHAGGGHSLGGLKECL